MPPLVVSQRSWETKSEKNVPQECRMHSWGAKEAESVTEGIMHKPKVHYPVIFSISALMYYSNVYKSIY